MNSTHNFPPNTLLRNHTKEQMDKLSHNETETQNNSSHEKIEMNVKKESLRNSQEYEDKHVSWKYISKMNNKIQPTIGTLLSSSTKQQTNEQTKKMVPQKISSKEKINMNVQKGNLRNSQEYEDKHVSWNCASELNSKIKLRIEGNQSAAENSK